MILSQRASEIIDGLVLSDASIQFKPKRGKSCVRMMQSPLRRGWLDSLQETFGLEGIVTWIYRYEKKGSVWGDRVMPSRTYDTLISKNYESLNEYRRRWYPEGHKKVPEDLVLTPTVLTHWFCGDGRGGDRKGTLGFCTDGFGVDEVDFLVRRMLEDLDIKSIRTVNGRGHPQILVGRRDEAVKIMRLVDPEIPDCCRYKLQHVRPLQTSGIGRRLSESAIKAVSEDRGTMSMRMAAEKHGISVSKVWKLWRR